MQPLYGTDADSREYHLPAPWGSFILTESFGDVWEIAPSFDAVTEPDAAPAPVADVMGLLDDLIQTGRNLTTDEVARLLSTPRAQNFSAFTRKVLTTVAEIPAGDFLTYGDVAAAVGSPKAQQAVGRALAVNPFFVLIPCHRVVSAAAKAAFDVLNPQTFQTPAFPGRPEFAGIGAWLRLHDLAQAA